MYDKKRTRRTVAVHRIIRFRVIMISKVDLYE